MSDNILVFESDDYREEREKLKADPIIKAMAKELEDGLKDGRVTPEVLVHPSGGPQSWFMTSAGREYSARAEKRAVEERGEGSLARSIGGPARAIIELLGLPHTEQLPPEV